MVKMIEAVGIWGGREMIRPADIYGWCEGLDKFEGWVRIKNRSGSLAWKTRLSFDEFTALMKTMDNRRIIKNDFLGVGVYSWKG